MTTGLFRVSRHPNFFFEQAQWWAFYAIGATAAVASGLGLWGGALNWTIVGAALLTLLFIGSTIFTESITASKYPAYAEYQRRDVDARAAAPARARRRDAPQAGLRVTPSRRSRTRRGSWTASSSSRGTSRRS